MEKGSVAACFVEGALSRLRERGLDAGAVLRAAGITPEALQGHDARVTAEQYGALWRQVAVALDDEFFGQDARRMKVGSFAMLCYAVVHCATLGQALARALRFFGLLLDDFRVDLMREPGVARLVVTQHARSGPPRVFGHEALLILLHGLASWLAGRRIPIRSTSFAYPEPEHSREYRAMYGTDLRYDAPATAITLDVVLLALPVVQNERSARAFLRAAPANIIVKYKNTEGLAARVRRHLKRLPLDAWPDVAALAAHFHLTASTLRRRLEEEGQSYRAIKDQLRRDLAIERLTRTRLSVMEIALELGFADPSTFHRAFRKWTGERPGEYRRRGAAAA